MAFIFTACNSNNAKTETTKDTTATAKEAATSQATVQIFACSMHPEVTGKKGVKCSKCGMELSVPVKETTKPSTTESKPNAQGSNAVINEVVVNYLKLKNALTKDDTKEAANAGNAIVATLSKLDMKSLSTTQMKSYMDIADDAKENAEHIGANAGKLDHQREHFALLSKDIADLIKAFGSSLKLYQDFCPMYDDGKGAIWISELKEIKNPYFGTKMIGCGSMKKEL